jgi:hypothetical protein
MTHCGSSRLFICLTRDHTNSSKDPAYVCAGVADRFTWNHVIGSALNLRPVYVMEASGLLKFGLWNGPPCPWPTASQLRPVLPAAAHPLTFWPVRDLSANDSAGALIHDGRSANAPMRICEGESGSPSLAVAWLLAAAARGRRALEEMPAHGTRFLHYKIVMNDDPDTEVSQTTVAATTQPVPTGVFHERSPGDIQSLPAVNQPISKSGRAMARPSHAFIPPAPQPGLSRASNAGRADRYGILSGTRGSQQTDDNDLPVRAKIPARIRRQRSRRRCRHPQSTQVSS